MASITVDSTVLPHTVGVLTEEAGEKILVFPRMLQPVKKSRFTTLIHPFLLQRHPGGPEGTMQV